MCAPIFQKCNLNGLQHCYNPSLGLTTKVRACKGASQKCNLGVTFHSPRNVGECEEMNSHTPKWVPTLGVRLPMDSQIFKRQLKGSKLIGFRSSLFHYKVFQIYMFKMGSHDPFRNLKHKLWSKERPRVKSLI
jgi:hypothetical protein